jgi:hypothetical protein
LGWDQRVRRSLDLGTLSVAKRRDRLNGWPAVLAKPGQHFAQMVGKGIDVGPADDGVVRSFYVNDFQERSYRPPFFTDLFVRFEGRYKSHDDDELKWCRATVSLTSRS